MRSWIATLFCAAALLGCSLVLPARAQQSDTQDQVHIPVLKKRPPADDTAQAQSTAQSPTATDEDPNRPVLKRRPPADTAPQASPQSPAPAPTTTSPAQTVPATGNSGATTATQPPPTSNHDHHADVMRHGAEAMGFDQQTTTHHFLLTRSGGVVRVTVNDPADTNGVGQISVHLRQMAAQFSRGDFRAPELTHGMKPPGTAVMQQMRNKILYVAHAIQDGAELIISSSDPKAIDAIHQFLQFQIQDHQTGDSAAVR